MKLILKNIFILLFTVSALVSCKKDDDNPADPRSENKKALGASAEEILSSDLYTAITVEFVYSNGFRPQQETLNAFRSLIEARVNKPGGITFVETQIDPPQTAPYTSEEIRTIENENRTKFTEGTNIALYVFFANGSSSNDTNTSVTLGTAYQNTSIVVYEKTLQSVSENSVFAAEALLFLEQNTLNHEFGHVLGLVNIQNDDIHPTGHEDPNHTKHCVITDCLMYFESNNPFRILERVNQRGAVPEFDSLCLEDLRAKGGL